MSDSKKSRQSSRSVADDDLAPDSEPPPSSSGRRDFYTKPKVATIEQRHASAQKRIARADDTFRKRYEEAFHMSWIYHDSALEGVVYTGNELKMALDPTLTVVPDSSLQPVCEEIRRHRDTINYIRELAGKKRSAVSVDMIKRIYLTLHPDEGDLKSLRYRKDVPQHRLYFHEYAPPEKISHRMRQIVEWVNDPETKKGRTIMRIAAKAHYEILKVFPFGQNSGKVARLLMNLLLIRNGYPPAIIHSTERQRYYEALKNSPLVVAQMVNDALDNGLASIEKMLDEYETRTRSFTT